MKKTLLLILAGLLSALLFTSCGNSDTDAPLGYKEISGEDVDYDLFVPEEWQPDISTGMTAAYYSSRDPANISLIAFELDGSVKSIEDYWNSYLPGLTAVFPDIKFENIPEDTETEASEAESAEDTETAAVNAEPVIGEPEQLKLDGVPALAYNYTGSMNGTAYKFYQVIAFRNSRVYIFTYTAEADNYDAHIEDVVSILGNFKFN